MNQVTHDRGEIIDFIGKQSGSPGIAADGSPTIITGHDAGTAKRVGWPDFFKAVDSKGVSLQWASDGAWSFVPRHAAK